MKQFLLLLLVLPGVLAAQERMVLNGGFVRVENGAWLVVQNSSPDALTRLSADGGIMVNDAFSRIRWHIGLSAGSYSVPFVWASEVIPLGFTTTGGTGAGYFDFTTYQTPTWKNIDYLPPGVPHLSGGGGDNSHHIIDRFWLISAQGYGTKPSLSNVSFTYRDEEWSAAGNVITEPLLKAQRYNSIANTWSDFPPSGIDNTIANFVSVPNVAFNQLFDWWTLVDSNFPLPIQLVFFTAHEQDNTVVQTAWRTSTESNTSHFLVERSANGLQFETAGTVAAVGNTTNEQNYSFTDSTPFRGRSYYRLKIVDNDNSFKYSSIVTVMLTGNELVRIFPNPVIHKLTIELGNVDGGIVTLSDANGKLLVHRKATTGSLQLDLSYLPAGVYWLKIIGASGTKTYKVMKVAE